MSDGASRAPRNDPGMLAIANDPDVKAAVAQRRNGVHPDICAAVEKAIAASGEKELKGWVAVALWDDSSETVMCDDHSSVLEVKGILHDAVWATAHLE